MDVFSLLDGGRGLPALSADQLQVQVMLALRGYDNLILISSLFWGLWLFPLGWLVFRSGFTLRVLGVLLMLGGFSYVLGFAGPVLVADYADTLLGHIVGYASGIPSMIGEVGTFLWLLIMGARERKPTARPAAPTV